MTTVSIAIFSWCAVALVGGILLGRGIKED